MNLLFAISVFTSHSQTLNSEVKIPEKLQPLLSDYALHSDRADLFKVVVDLGSFLNQTSTALANIAPQIPHILRNATAVGALGLQFSDEELETMVKFMESPLAPKFGQLLPETVPLAIAVEMPTRSGGLNFHRILTALGELMTTSSRVIRDILLLVPEFLPALSPLVPKIMPGYVLELIKLLPKIEPLVPEFGRVLHEIGHLVEEIYSWAPGMTRKMEEANFASAMDRLKSIVSTSSSIIHTIVPLTPTILDAISESRFLRLSPSFAELLQWARPFLPYTGSLLSRPELIPAILKSLVMGPPRTHIPELIRHVTPLVSDGLKETELGSRVAESGHLKNITKISLATFLIAPDIILAARSEDGAESPNLRGSEGDDSPESENDDSPESENDDSPESENDDSRRLEGDDSLIAKSREVEFLMELRSSFFEDYVEDRDALTKITSEVVPELQSILPDDLFSAMSDFGPVLTEFITAVESDKVKSMLPKLAKSLLELQGLSLKLVEKESDIEAKAKGANASLIGVVSLMTIFF